MKKDMLKDRMVGLRESYYRKGFTRLKEASGTEEVDEMIAKLVYTQETQGRLLGVVYIGHMRSVFHIICSSETMRD